MNIKFFMVLVHLFLAKYYFCILYFTRIRNTIHRRSEMGYAGPTD